MTPAVLLGSPVGSGGAAVESPAQSDPSKHRVLVGYWSRFGNTQRVAKALATGLQQVPGIMAECTNIDSLLPPQLGRYELIALGGPTEILSAPGAIKKFLDGLRPEEVRGKLGFAFDTRLDSRLSGSAGRYIERHLERLGMEIVRPHASALVRGMTKEERALAGDQGAPDWAQRIGGPHAPTSPPEPFEFDLLASGSEAKFVEIGVQIGEFLRAVVPFAVA